MKRVLILVAAIAATAMASPVLAQAARNLEQLKQMRVSGTDLNIPTVPQEGRNAATELSVVLR